MFVNGQSGLASLATREEPQHGAPPILHLIGQPPFHSSTGSGMPVPIPLQLQFRIQIRFASRSMCQCSNKHTVSWLQCDGMSAHAIWWEKTEGSQSYPFDIGPKQFKQQFPELQRTHADNQERTHNKSNEDRKAILQTSEFHSFCCLSYLLHYRSQVKVRIKDRKAILPTCTQREAKCHHRQS